MIVALTGLATALFVGVAGWRVANGVARKDAVTLLREEVARLHEQITKSERQQEKADNRITQLEEERILLIDDVASLRQYNRELRTLLVKAGIADVPPMPTLNSDGWVRHRRTSDPNYRPPGDVRP